MELKERKTEQLLPEGKRERVCRRRKKLRIGRKVIGSDCGFPLATSL